MIAIVNYGSGNVQAICNIYNRLGIPHAVASTSEQIHAGDKIILPGVGAFDQAIGELEKSGLRAALDEVVLRQGRPMLGICVGMQLLANGSEEGTQRGLGWINGEVKKFDRTNFPQADRLPHMGWNTAASARTSPLLKDVDLEQGFYFLHSYYFACADRQDELMHTSYGGRYASAVNRGNIYGVQFHPEKSHQAGIQLLKNFAFHV